MKKITKEKQEELDNLSNEYFWEQKTNEVVGFIAIICLSFVAIYISGSIVGMLDPSTLGLNILVRGLLGLMVLGIVGAFAFVIFGGLYCLLERWIKDNKEEAERRARNKLGIEYDGYGY